jgi:hypothetical protein
MRFTRTSSWAIVIAAGIALIASAADARPRHSRHDEHAPQQYGRAYHAYGPTSEEFFGTSVPYDPDGPAYNDFQMQGRE